jgi:acetolactate synthase-1/2/3 large subunit
MPIKIVIINNHCHGMVRQFQDSYFHGRVQSTVWGYSAPSFKAIASAYGISSGILKQENEVESALACLWEEKNKPFLLEVTIPTEVNAYPKMAFGKGITEMEPLAKPIDMEGT